MNSQPAMKDNFCFDKTGDLDLVVQAIIPILQKPYFAIKRWTYGKDTDNDDIMVFFDLRSINKMDFGKYHFFVSLKNAWRDAGLKFVEQTELPKYEYSRVGFDSVCFRLKRITYNEP